MGAWGPGNFENDHALDWLSNFLGGEDEGPIYEALDVAVDQPDFDLDTSSSEAALAAAEVVAAMIGKPSPEAPEELVGWARGLEGAEIDPELTDLAARAVRRIRDHSELREHWDDEPAWLAAVDDLLGRLARV